jgi:hypothetical protein
MDTTLTVALPGFFAWSTPNGDIDTVDVSEENHL